MQCKIICRPLHETHRILVIGFARRARAGDSFHCHVDDLPARCDSQGPVSWASRSVRTLRSAHGRVGAACPACQTQDQRKETCHGRPAGRELLRCDALQPLRWLRILRIDGRYRGQRYAFAPIRQVDSSRARRTARGIPAIRAGSAASSELTQHYRRP